MLDTSDNLLLRRWLQGERAAAEELIDRYGEALHRFFAARAAQSVEDLVQQVFLSLLENASRFEERSSVRAYVFGIARRQLYNHYRSLGRHPSATPPTTIPASGTTPSAKLAREQLYALLRQALSALPTDQQIALELLYWEGLAPAEIAEVLEIPRDTVYTRVRRARERLATALEEIDPSRSWSQVEQLMGSSSPNQKPAPR